MSTIFSRVGRIGTTGKLLSRFSCSAYGHILILRVQKSVSADTPNDPGMSKKMSIYKNEPPEFHTLTVYDQLLIGLTL
jgi:hypothetical protein